MVQLTDTLTLDRDARICADGSLVAEVFAARTGLQDYLGREADPENKLGLRDKAITKVYRPEGEVFKTDSLATFAAAPVTVDHPSVEVTADNWRDLGVGEINGDVVRDGQRVRVPIIVRDAAAVKAATTTHKQLSMGYATDLVVPPDGKHPDGTVCDAYQTNIRVNHIALVRAARGGPELRVVDERSPAIPSTGDLPMKTLTIDGLRVPNVSDEAEAAIAKLQADKAAAETKLADAEAKVVEHTATITARDARITELEQAVADAAITPAKLADAAKVYADVQAKAKALGVTVAADADTAAIKKAVVDAKMGDAAKDYTADHIDIAFEALTKDAQAKPTVPNGIVQPLATDGAAAVATTRAAWLADKQTAYRGQAAN